MLADCTGGSRLPWYRYGTGADRPQPAACAGRRARIGIRRILRHRSPPLRRAACAAARRWAQTSFFARPACRLAPAPRLVVLTVQQAVRPRPQPCTFLLPLLPLLISSPALCACLLENGSHQGSLAHWFRHQGLHDQGTDLDLIFLRPPFSRSPRPPRTRRTSTPGSSLLSSRASTSSATSRPSSRCARARVRPPSFEP